MAYSKLIITTNAVGAVHQFIQNNLNGFVVENANTEALITALRKLIENKGLAKRLGKKSREIYDREINLSRQISVFKKALDHDQKN